MNEQNLRRIAILFVAVLAGIWLRSAFPAFDSPDSLYHLRRARFTVTSFPDALVFDPLINYPAGGVVIWPPLFDVCLALPAWILDGRAATPAEIEILAHLVPPGFAIGAILVAGALGFAIRRRRFDGAMAAILVAIAPGHIEYSQYGHTDQHVAESFWGSLTLACLLWSVRTRTPRIAIVLEAASGIALCAAVLSWQGAIFWAPLFAAAIGIEAIRAPSPVLLRKAILSLGLPTILVGAATWFWIGGWDLPFTYVSFGWFQPVFLAVMTTTLTALIAIAGVVRRNQRLAVAAGIVTLVFAIPTLRFFPRAIDVTLGAVAHLAGTSEGMTTDRALLSYSREWLDRIVEYRPLLADGGWSVAWLSFAFFLAPVSLWFWTRRAMKGRDRLLHLLLVLWALFVFLVTLSSRRNVYYGATLAAVVAVDLSARFAVVMRRRFLSRGEGRRARDALFLAFFLVLVMPLIIGFPREISEGYEIDPGRASATYALRGLAVPRVDAFDTRDLKAESATRTTEDRQGVLALWSMGHTITYYAELPVVANNFGYGYEDSLRFLFADTESDALEIVRRRRVRWIVVWDILPLMNDYGSVATSGRVFAIASPRGWVPTPDYFRTMQARLFSFGGAGGRVEGLVVRPLEHFVPRWESDSTVMHLGEEVPAWRIFEVVDQPASSTTVPGSAGEGD